MTCTLVVNPEMIAYVDDEDAALLRRYTWSRSVRPHTTYAVTWLDGKQVYLHKLILNYYGDDPIDHRNGNGLDCRKHNMRITSRTINQLNRQNALGVKEREVASGVVYETTIRVDGVNTHLGRFKTFEVARRVVDLNRRRLIRGERPVAYKGEHRWDKPKWVYL